MTRTSKSPNNSANDSCKTREAFKISTKLKYWMPLSVLPLMSYGQCSSSFRRGKLLCFTLNASHPWICYLKDHMLCSLFYIFKFLHDMCVFYLACCAPGYMCSNLPRVPAIIAPALTLILSGVFGSLPLRGHATGVENVVYDSLFMRLWLLCLAPLLGACVFV